MAVADRPLPSKSSRNDGDEMNIAVLILILLMMATLFYKFRRDGAYQLQVRQHMFDELESLLQHSTRTTDKANLPVLQGSYGGYKVAFSVVEDSIGWRKLPPLWLLVKVEANRATTGTLDMIVRPANNEFYSPSWQWDGNLAIPASWPQHAIMKYHQQAVDVALLGRHVPAMFADDKMKEVLLLPNMVRLTYMVKQAERGEYLIMRNTVFDAQPIDKTVAEGLLKQAIALRTTMESELNDENK